MEWLLLTAALFMILLGGLGMFASPRHPAGPIAFAAGWIIIGLAGVIIEIRGLRKVIARLGDRSPDKPRP